MFRVQTKFNRVQPVLRYQSLNDAKHHLVVIEHQSPHLNTLPWRIVLMRWIHKCGVWDPPRPPIVNGIVAFDKQRLVRPLGIFEIPPVIRVRLHGIRLALAIGIDEFGGHEVAFGDRVGICEGQGVSVDCFYGTPDLNRVSERLGVCRLKRGGV
jgi:hypothetical protein